MHGRRKQGTEMCGVKSRRPRHTRAAAPKNAEWNEKLNNTV